MKTAWFGTAVLAAAVAVPAGMMSARANAAPAAPGLSQYQDRSWDQPPDNYQDAQRMGYRDGIQAARSDYESGHHKDADDHQAYKHPPVDGRDRGAYRDAFKQGYSEAMHHMKDNRYNNGRHHHDDDDNRAPY